MEERGRESREPVPSAHGAGWTVTAVDESLPSHENESEANVRRNGVSNEAPMSQTDGAVPVVHAMRDAMQQTMQMFLEHLQRHETQRQQPGEAGGASVPAFKTDARFRLAAFDPDDTAHTVAEWLDNVTQIKDRLLIDESWMIIRCADALKGRALTFYNHWRPVERSWLNFCTDLANAFPDGETHGTRMLRAATLGSNEFNTLTDYVLAKIRYLKRFLSSLSWEIILSCVVTGLENQTARNLIQARQPQDQQGLLQLLGQYEAERSLSLKRRVDDITSKRRGANQPPRDTKVGRWEEPTHDDTKKNHLRRNVNDFRGYFGGGRSENKLRGFDGLCFTCGKRGHQKKNCPGASGSQRDSSKETVTSPKQCTYCKKSGHVEEECFSKKHGKPRVAQCVRPVRSFCQTPIATTLLEGKAYPFSYFVDSGSDVSLIRESVAKRMNIALAHDDTVLDTVGTTVVCRGNGSICAALTNVVAEIEFRVIADSSMPGDSDALIGLDVIRRPELDIAKEDGCVDLIYKRAFVPSVASVHLHDEIEVDFEKSGLAEVDRQQLLSLLMQFRGKTAPYITTGQMEVKLVDSTPVAYRPRHLAYAERVRVKALISDMLQKGIVRESHSEYASPIVLVSKKDGSLRLCVDYRDLNKRVAKDRYPLPRIQDHIDALYKYRYFTVLDMKAGFHQMRIEESSKHLFAFVTPDGHYEFNVMPFGFVNAPSCYQRAIDKALGDLKNDIAYVYLDDIICPAVTMEEAFQNLALVLDVLAKGGFSLNLTKCHFFQTEIEYLGFRVGNGLLRPSLFKVEALAKAPPPKDKRGVRQLMGLAGYFRRFIRGFAVRTAPITALLRKDVDFKWKESHEAVRQEIIRLLTSEPILAIYNPDEEVELHTDACSVGIGGMLLQKQEDKMHPVAYFSRQTTQCESNYHSYDLETLAIVDATQYFRVYLYGRHFVVFTDCNAVRATAVKKEMNTRVARWWIKLQEYDFDIQYRPGHKMEHVDYLSRNPIVQRVSNRKVMQAPLRSMEEYQKCDKVCQKFFEGTLPSSEQKQFQDKNGLVYRVIGAAKTLRCYVPDKARLRVLKAYHDESTHIGAGKMIDKLRETLYWPRLQKCVRKYVNNCRACAVGKSHTGNRQGLYQLGEKATKPLDVWHIDHAGPLVKSKGCTQILVVIDAFSKFCKLVPISKKTSHDAIVALDNVFLELGHPRRIIADRGTAFSSNDFAEFLQAFGCALHLVATGVPRGNGTVERLMRTTFNLMRPTLTVEKESTWIEVIAEVEENINNTVSATTGVTPSVLMFGENKKLRASEPLLQSIPQPSVNLKAVTEMAKIRAEESYKGTVDRLNKGRKAPHSFAVGDHVLVEDTQAPGRGKLGARYKGPYVVKELLPNDRYRLGKGGKRETVAARDQLRSWPAVDAQMN